MTLRMIRQLAANRLFLAWLCLSLGPMLCGNAAVLPVSFSAPASIDPAVTDIYTMVAGDVTGDARPDIVLIQLGPKAIVYQGTSNGLFQPFSTNTLSPLSLAYLADANNDGALDLLTLAPGNNGFDCYLNNGRGFTHSHYVNTGSTATTIAFLDVNKDGNLDFALSMINGMRVNVYLGDGAGHFGLYSQHDIGFRTYAVAAADLDKDGYTDLVTVNGESARSISILYGASFSRFSAPVNYPIPEYGVGITIKDLNGDGWPDIVVGAGYGIVVLQGGPNRTIVQSNYFPAISPGSLWRLTVADLNNDGVLDILAGSEYMLGSGNGMFENSVSSGLFFSDVIDLNMDGRKDLVGSTAIAYNTTMPRFSVNRHPSGLRFSWPKSLGTNFQLQTTTENFSTNDWLTFQPAVSVNSNDCSFLLQTTNVKSFFQLKNIP